MIYNIDRVRSTYIIYNIEGIRLTYITYNIDEVRSTTNTLFLNSGIIPRNIVYV